MPGNSVNANLSLPSNFVPDNTSNVRQQGEFRARTVSLGTSSPFVERIANTNKPDHATPLIARTVAEGVGEGFAMGNISRFSTYLANNVERGRISRDLLPDFETAVTFANQVDKDICKSGKDRTGQLDAEVKYLAALAEHEKLPRPGSVGPDLRAMRSEFTLNAGNLEMQKLNSGLPGYKLPLREVPGLAQMIADQALESVYRGGSDYIKS